MMDPARVRNVPQRMKAVILKIQSEEITILKMDDVLRKFAKVNFSQNIKNDSLHSSLTIWAMLVSATSERTPGILDLMIGSFCSSFGLVSWVENATEDFEK